MRFCSKKTIYVISISKETKAFTSFVVSTVDHLHHMAKNHQLNSHIPLASHTTCFPVMECYPQKNQKVLSQQSNMTKLSLYGAPQLIAYKRDTAVQTMRRAITHNFLTIY